MPMKVGSVFVYEPTQSMATNGATRQIPMTTRTGVTTGSLLTSVSSDMRGSVPSLITSCSAHEM
ncbi:hypothetical protein RGQ21_27250 [Kitasatospora aureofaciens]|nr:hypothetical protein RGQ21_27250 [Kitasatospora aureofaciens]GHA58376.1 hypothetical protein GCM10010330_07780 [Streptomyces tendae]